MAQPGQESPLMDAVKSLDPTVVEKLLKDKVFTVSEISDALLAAVYSLLGMVATLAGEPVTKILEAEEKEKKYASSKEQNERRRSFLALERETQRIDVPKQVVIIEILLKKVYSLLSFDTYLDYIKTLNNAFEAAVRFKRVDIVTVLIENGIFSIGNIAGQNVPEEHELIANALDNVWNLASKSIIKSINKAIISSGERFQWDNIEFWVNEGLRHKFLDEVLPSIKEALMNTITLGNKRNIKSPKMVLHGLLNNKELVEKLLEKCNSEEIEKIFKEAVADEAVETLEMLLKNARLHNVPDYINVINEAYKVLLQNTETNMAMMIPSPFPIGLRSDLERLGSGGRSEIKAAIAKLQKYLKEVEEFIDKDRADSEEVRYKVKYVEILLLLLNAKFKNLLPRQQLPRSAYNPDSGSGPQRH